VRRFKLLAGVLVCVGACSLVAPFFWRAATYKSLRRTIEAGNEAEAIERVNGLARNPVFQIDWTISAAMPEWRWVWELDLWLFGCPTCRGNGRTLLQSAAASGQANLVATMFTNGASTNLYGDGGLGVLTSAAVGGDTNIIAMLIAHGADVKATTQRWSVIKAAAAFAKSTNVLAFLIQAGAEVNQVDEQGWTAWDWANKVNPAALPFLEAAGARSGTNYRKR
jgi:hypothetical protein